MESAAKNCKFEFIWAKSVTLPNGWRKRQVDAWTPLPARPDNDNEKETLIQKYWDTFRNIDIDHPCIGMFWSALIADMQMQEKKKKCLDTYSAAKVFIYFWLL